MFAIGQIIFFIILLALLVWIISWRSFGWLGSKIENKINEIKKEMRK